MKRCINLRIAGWKPKQIAQALKTEVPGFERGSLYVNSARWKACTLDVVAAQAKWATRFGQKMQTATGKQAYTDYAALYLANALTKACKRYGYEGLQEEMLAYGKFIKEQERSKETEKMNKDEKRKRNVAVGSVALKT